MDVLAVLFLALIIIIIFLVLFSKLDCNLSLYYYEKFRCLPKYYFKDQVVWITGGSSGIGEHLAYEFAASGARLVISGTSIQKLQKVKETCLEKYNLKDDDVLLVPFSIENFSEHETLVQKVIDTFGRIDILINNAGRSQRADFHTIDIEVDLKLFNINVFGAVNLTRKVLKHMLERHQGQIVVTSSIAGKLGGAFASAYCGSKHALHGYFESLRIEMIEEKNIHITMVCPGPTFSNVTRRLFSSKLNELYDEKQQPTHKKMSAERCSHLMVIGVAHKFDECLLFPPIFLFKYYVAQYAPSFIGNYFKKIAYNKLKAETMGSGHKKD